MEHGQVFSMKLERAMDDFSWDISDETFIHKVLLAADPELNLASQVVRIVHIKPEKGEKLREGMDMWWRSAERSLLT
jgi:hypothetical protein